MNYANLREMLEDRVAETPDQVFMAFYEESITYAELNDRVNRFANVLLSLGIEKGEVVNIHLFNCPDHFVACMAAFKIGAVACPVNFQFKPEELLYQVNDSEGVVILTESALANVSAEVRGKLSSIRHIVEIGEAPNPGNLSFAELVTGKPTDLPPSDVAADDNAIILYTSGTTGPAKGALLTHGNFLYMTEAVSELLDSFDEGHDRPRSTKLVFLPMFHVNPLMHNFMAIWRGDKNVLLRRFSVREFGPVVEKERPDYFFGVPKVFKILLEAADTVKLHDLSSIRTATCGAAPIPPETIAAFRKEYGIDITEGYGLTEATFASTMNPPRGEKKVGSIGVALQGQEVCIMSPEGDLLGPGETGEIVIRGPSLMKEYYRKEPETAKSLRDGWLHTGDVGRMDEDGYFFIVDRIKDMIIKGGENISPKEIEDAIMEMPDVHDAAVIGIPDPMAGEEVKAFVVPCLGTRPSEQEIQAHCRGRLAPYKVPKQIEFILGIPTSAVGKALKRKLRDGEGIIGMNEEVQAIPLEMVWAGIASRFKPEKARNWRAKIAYEIYGVTSGAVTFIIDEGRIETQEGKDPEATAVVKMTDVALTRIIEGKLDMLTGINSGLVQVEGNESDMSMFGEALT